MSKKLIYLMSFVLVLAVTGTASAQLTITVPDAGFDDHVLNNVGDYIYIGDSSYTGAWKSDAVNGAYVDYGYWKTQGSPEDLPARSGNNKAYPSDGETFDYIYQILGETFIEGKMYTLSVWVGNAWPRQGYADGWGLYFTGENYRTNLIEAHGLALSGKWEQISLVYTATAADAGKKIGIKMSGEQGESYITFDDVTLSYGPPKARDPDPADGAIVMDTWVTLSWTPGKPAVSHDVYLGDDLVSITDGTRDSPVYRGNQTSIFYVAGFPGFAYPDGLMPGATYYWRIDEVEADGTTIYKGDVWSFSIPPRIAYNPVPADGAEFVALDSKLSWTAGFGAKLHTVYFGTDFDTVSNATGGLPHGTTTYTPSAIQAEKVYYWRVDEFDGTATYKGNIWAFTTPGAAGNPQPSNGAASVPMVVTLSWTPATNAISHDVYFGTDKEAVRNATIASTEYKGNKAKGSESYDPGKLAWYNPYFWRADAVYSTGTVKGLVWSFTTADFISVDDFESYNDIDPPDPASNRIFDKWIDGFANPATNGALVGNELPPYAEPTIVHSGVQSMPYRYDNTNKTSEATLTLVYPRDWTEEGVTRLSLWFRGSPINSAERIFVALNGDSIVYHDSPAPTQTSRWTEWVIDLQAFQGVNLTNVNTLTIGFGTKNSPAAGGPGKMYFDDIRLYRPATP